jgi:hypothetical protein
LVEEAVEPLIAGFMGFVLHADMTFARRRIDARNAEQSSIVWTIENARQESLTSGIDAGTRVF